MPVIECDVDRARARLVEAGITIEAGNTDHEEWRASVEGATAVAYAGKIVVQGTNPTAVTAHLRSGAGRADVYFDGASRGNPGPAAVGWTIVTDGGIVAENGKRIGTTTNNRAEYEALIAALEAADRFGFDDLAVRGDSELVVRQIRGEYDTNDPDLRERRVRARELLDRFGAWSIDHVPREVNDRADELANEALDGTR
ncbi:ribonuclease H [Halobacteriales archaeon SW_7_68_16]|nr:MAG: ribonuclease H [Halobacteriales archaeon SW_7_68_16]